MRLVAATALALAGMVAVKTPFFTGARRWLVAAAISLPLFLAALWIVVTAIPYPNDPAVPTFSIVASGVFVAALAVEELIGADLRRFLGKR